MSATVTKIVELSAPLILGGKPLSSVTMRQATIGDEEDAMQMTVKLGRAQNLVTLDMCIMSALTGVPYDALRTLSSRDYNKIKAAYFELNGAATSDPTQSATPETI